MGGHDLGECLLTTGYACSICWASIKAARQETDAREEAGRTASLERGIKSAPQDTETTPDSVST